MMAIVILGAPVHATGPSPALLRRTEHAIALWRTNPEAVIVACGGIVGHPPSEAEVMRDLLLDAGVDAAAVICEGRSRNTAENVSNARRILAARGIAEAVIVTDRYHVPRARLVARFCGLQASFASPPDRGPRFWRMVGREICAYPVYALRLARQKARGQPHAPF